MGCQPLPRVHSPRRERWSESQRINSKELLNSTKSRRLSPRTQTSKGTGLYTHHCLFFWDFEFSGVDLVDQIVGWSGLNGAADGLARSQDFSDRSAQLSGHGTRPHRASDRDHLVEGQVSAVLDVLLLLTVPWRFLQSLDYQRRCRWHDWDCRYSVLDRQLDCDLKTLPVACRLRDVISHFFRGL